MQITSSRSNAVLQNLTYESHYTCMYAYKCLYLKFGAVIVIVVAIAVV